MRQREQLENTESRLDEINNTLRFSQKHITSIKVQIINNLLIYCNSFFTLQSVFGSLKNYISGRVGADKQQAPSGSTSSPRPAEISRESSALANRLQTMQPSSPNDDHPGEF